ncbi:hypothetical protein C2E23DRAFT_92111 [Lenzites betulinus]|nr:hypothetical protein C2E23DRAFT_92111 [Lenzites betulinus]
MARKKHMMTDGSHAICEWPQTSGHGRTAIPKPSHTPSKGARARDAPLAKGASPNPSDVGNARKPSYADRRATKKTCERPWRHAHLGKSPRTSRKWLHAYTHIWRQQLYHCIGTLHCGTYLHIPAASAPLVRVSHLQSRREQQLDTLGHGSWREFGPRKKRAPPIGQQAFSGSAAIFDKRLGEPARRVRALLQLRRPDPARATARASAHGTGEKPQPSSLPPAPARTGAPGSWACTRTLHPCHSRTFASLSAGSDVHARQREPPVWPRG